MDVIHNDTELKTAYEILSLYDALNHGKKNHKTIIETKKAIRNYNRQESPVKYIYCNYDGYTEIVTLPDDITTAEEAESYFINNLKRRCRPSLYDCTGDSFTIWHKIIKRHNKFIVYHHIGLDV